MKLETVFTPREVAKLRRFHSRSYAVMAHGLLSAFCFLCILAGAAKLWTAVRLSALQGVAVWTNTRGWIAGIDPERTYSGIEIAAQERVASSALYFSVAVLTLVFLAMFRQRLRVEGKLLRAIEAQTS